MVYDENIEKDQERLIFRKELDQYLSQRRQIIKKGKRAEPKEMQNKDSKKVTLEIYDEMEDDDKPTSFIMRIKSLFLRRKKEAVSEEYVEEEIIDEEPIESEEESFNEEFEELEDERSSSGFFSRIWEAIKGIFVKEDYDEEIDETEEEESKPEVSVEELENDLKTTFKLVKAILTNIPSRYVLKIKELPEFKEYKEVINRYNERHKKIKQ